MSWYTRKKETTESALDDGAKQRVLAPLIPFNKKLKVYALFYLELFSCFALVYDLNHWRVTYFPSNEQHKLYFPSAVSSALQRLTPKDNEILININMKRHFSICGRSKVINYGLVHFFSSLNCLKTELRIEVKGKF
ncbi:hypothetical protein KQX54_017436 [Cotesia glomerata]|uniref:Uncharacterized protein n=1 Tax=Cotesia glomerata TaxID=32391 RepID=A0AAV7IEM7_COTGL|nr:hypothetical protein KQX54_017436 [Cotesia glomerata]